MQTKILFPIVLLAICSCGGSDPKALTDAGSAALNSGDPKGAAASFERALEHMDPGHPDYRRASIGRCEALARIDPNRAKDEFLSFSRTHPGLALEPDYAAVAHELVRRGAIGPAAIVAEEGLKKFPDSTAMKSLRDTVGDAAKKASDPEALQKLKGLGYAGDG